MLKMLNWILKKKKQSQTRIAVILPSRGMIFSQTVEELLRELTPYSYEIFWSHNNPIPDCFNKPLDKALEGDFSHVWFVEEDMAFPQGVLAELLSADQDAVACDYPLVKKASGTILYESNHKAFFTGTGCLLVKRHVFDKLPRPVFRSDIKWQFVVNSKGAVFTAHNFKATKATPHPYGLHDITFGLQLFLMGSPIHVITTWCKQRELVKKGPKNNNKGTHKIITYSKLRRHNASSLWRYNKASRLDDAFTEIQMNDGSIIWAPPATAKKLIANGHAKKLYLEAPNIKLEFKERPELFKEFDQ